MRRVLTLALVSLFLFSCGDDEEPAPQGSCTDCTGCCDPASGCQPGITANLCGTDGAACTACAADQVCEQGQCVPAQVTCTDGCTVPGTNACMSPGTSNDACGPLAGVCDNCTDKDMICEVATRSCVSRPGECDPAAVFSCKSQESFCDDEQVCRNCPSGTYNCDGANDNGCESSTACDQPPNECASEVESWPENLQVASSNAVANLTQAEARLSDTQPFVLLRVEDFHKDTTYPKTVTFSSATTWGQPGGCDVCVMVAQGCTGFDGSAENYYTCMGKLFFAQEGTATVEQADVKPSPGAFKVTLSDLKLVEWDESADEPVANGDCWLVKSATIDASW